MSKYILRTCPEFYLTLKIVVTRCLHLPRRRNRILSYLETSPFVHFMVQILSPGSNRVHAATSFKILNDVTVCTLLDL